MANRYSAVAACCLALAMGSTMAGIAHAAPQVSATSAAIPPMPLKEALDEFARRNSLQLVYVSTITEGLRSQGAPAGLNAEATLQKLLEGTGLRFRFLNAQTVTIFSPSEAQTPRNPSSKKQVPVEEEPEPRVLKQVVVTGSHIRGAPPTSMTIDITQEQMARAGQTDLGEVIRSIPQNFSGGQNPGVALGAGGIGNQNMTGGSALNLRGLGSDATLTLLNGRRLSFNGFTQAVDISQIPLAAVERIEIVADGASAIYGSDAVAGVANVVLKRDYDGLSTTVRVGGATSGGEFEQQYSVVGGTRWTTGGFIATASYEKTEGLDAAQRGYTGDLGEPYSLLPERTVRSFVFSAHQKLSAHAEFKIDALYTRRDSNAAYNLGPVTTAIHRSPTEYVVSPTLTFQLPKSWSLSINGTDGRDEGIVDQAAYLPDGSVLSGSKACYCNRIEGWELDTEGPLFQLPGGDARVALGAGYRKNSYQDIALDDPAAEPESGQQHSYYAFGEIYLPVVSPSQDIAFVNQLSFNAALRREQYSSFGGITTPKIGVVYAPTADFDIKASWGKSFKTPTLLQQNQPFITYLWNAAAVGGASYPASATAVMTYGGNPDLEPERAKTWSVTLGLHPGTLPGFRAELGYFHIDYDQRVLQGITDRTVALSNPAYAPFLTFNPTLAQIQGAVASAGPRFYNYSNVLYDPGNVVAIINNRYVNVASWKTHGLDLSASYQLDWQGNSLTLSGDASWLDSEQQSTPTAPVVELAGTVFNPPHWHARFGATWERGSLVLSAYYSYIGGITDTMSQPNVEGDSMQTVDLTGIYHFPNDLDLSVSVKNLANKRPPYLRPMFSGVVNFDSTNYSPLGRFVGVTVNKRWY